MGAQSGSDRILKEIQRGHTVEDSISAVECCLKYKIIPTVDFIFGFPTETKDDQEKSLDMISWICRKGGIVRVHYLTPLPGTPYSFVVPAEVSDRVRSELGKLALEGKLTGYWEKHRKNENIRIDLTLMLFIRMYIFKTSCLTNYSELAN